MAGGVWRVLCPPGDAQSIGQRNVQRVWHEQGAREGCLRLRVIHQGGLAIQQMYCMYVRYNTIQYNTIQYTQQAHAPRTAQSVNEHERRSRRRRPCNRCLFCCHAGIITLREYFLCNDGRGRANFLGKQAGVHRQAPVGQHPFRSPWTSWGSTRSCC